MAAWYCQIGDKEYGPFSSERIQSLVKKGKLTKDHFVRPSTDTEWTAASDIPGLFPAEEPKAAAPKAKPPESPRPASPKPPVASAAKKPPVATALPATVEEAEIPSAIPVAAPVATPVAPPAALPVGTPVASSSSVIPEEGPGERLARVRKKSKQQRNLAVIGLVAVLLVLGGTAIAVLSGALGTKLEEDDGQVAQSTTDQTKAAAPMGDVEADPNPESDPAADEAARDEGGKQAALPEINRWLDASRQQGISRLASTMVRFHVVNVWLDSDESGPQTLTVEIIVTNQSASDSVDFRSWTLANDAAFDNAVVLTDDTDVRLSSSSSSGQGENARPATRRLKSKESVTEELVFDAPAGEYEHLRLRLPYAAIGITGHIGFRIPRVMIKDRPPDQQEPIATDPGPPVTEPETDDAFAKPEVVITPPESEAPDGMDVLPDSIKESTADDEEPKLKPKPKPESLPFPFGTPRQPKTRDD